MSTENTQLEKLEIYYQHEIGRNIDSLRFIQANRSILEKAESKPCLWGSYVDYDGLKRPELLKLMKAFGGKWTKTPSYDGGHLTYTRTEAIGGRTVRLSGEPPSSCKIIETIKWVKVPAKREKIVTRKVVCK
jgi:hypothetical protein